MAENVGHTYRGRPQTAWHQAQQWQSTRRAMAEHFLKQGKATRESFGAAWSSNIDDTIEFSFHVALNRINAAAEAKAAAANANPADLENWTPPTEVHAGASTIDLANGTITLGNGTQIDIRTSAKIDKKV